MRAVALIGASLVACLALVAGASSHSAPRSSVVLGSKDYAPTGAGFGRVAPRRIYNGGVPSGLIKNVHWRHWGNRKAKGRGRTYIYRPEGGYYRKSVRAKLKAHKRGHCPRGRKLAYKRLSIKVPKKPGGPLGHWRSWSGRSSICRGYY